MTNPADRNDAYLDALNAKISERAGRVIYDTTRAIFTADRFAWQDNAARTVIAARLCEIPGDTDLTEGITRAICAVYTDQDFPHDPDTVRQAVARHLGDGHGTLPPTARP